MQSMLRVVAAAAIVIIGIGTTRALAAPPTTSPSGAQPQAQPQARQPQDVQDPRPRVLVLPFDELADSPKREWVGKAMQQSLVAELTRSGMVSVVTPPADAPAAKDAKSAAKLARDLQAPLVIIGSYQLVDQDLRVTGQMLESINGEPVAAIKATGNLRDLFGMQDQIGDQVRRDLQAILGPQPTRPGQKPDGDPFTPKQPQPGSYTGSDLQRSLDDRWAPPAPTYDDTFARGGYPYPPYYPPYDYDYYDWCGYDGPIYGVVTIPRTPFNQQNNNYVTTPGQLGRTNQRIGNNHIQGPPGQLRGSGGASGGNSSSVQSAPGQMGRTSSGSTGRTSTGSSGRTSTGSPGQMRGSR